MVDITHLRDGLKSLKECSDFYNAAEDAKLKEFLGDAYIQRFEYTLEIA